MKLLNILAIVVVTLLSAQAVASTKAKCTITLAEQYPSGRFGVDPFRQPIVLSFDPASEESKVIRLTSKSDGDSSKNVLGITNSWSDSIATIELRRTTNEPGAFAIKMDTNNGLSVASMEGNAAAYSQSSMVYFENNVQGLIVLTCVRN